jgi:hypothetical protein
LCLFSPALPSFMSLYRSPGPNLGSWLPRLGWEFDKIKE